MALAALRRPHLWLALSLAAAPTAPAAVPSPAEHEVKAAFLFNFAKFVEWPPEAFASAEAPFTICLLGNNPFGAQLERLLTDKTIHERKLSIKWIDRAEEAGNCQLLFVGPAEGPRLREILAAVQNAPVLTVGDVDRFAERGGMIGFAMEGKKVRFHINPAPASSAGLKISSQLLKLAKVVE